MMWKTLFSLVFLALVLLKIKICNGKSGSSMGASYNCVNAQMSFVGILNAFILCVLFSLNLS